MKEHDTLSSFPNWSLKRLEEILRFRYYQWKGTRQGWFNDRSLDLDRDQPSGFFPKFGNFKNPFSGQPTGGVYNPGGSTGGVFNPGGTGGTFNSGPTGGVNNAPNIINNSPLDKTDSNLR